MRILWAVFVSPLLATVLALPAHATTVRYLSEKDMVESAASIARGHVLDTFSYDHPSGFIVTEVHIKVDKQLKGAPVAILTLTQLGGTIGERSIHVPGTNTYTTGEEVLVFASATANGLVEMGVGSGKYQIVRDHGSAQIKRQQSHLAIVDPKSPSKLIDPPPPVAENLESFENRIAALIAAAKQGGK